MISGICLFLPDKWLQYLHIKDMMTKYGPYIGIAFLVTSAYVILEGGIWFSQKYKISRQKYQGIKQAKKALFLLDPQEISVLREFILQNQQTLRFPILEPVIAGLIKKQILVQVQSIGEQMILGPLYSFMIADKLKKFVTRQFVGIPDDIQEDTIKWIQEHRPPFMETIEGRDPLRHSIGRFPPI